MYIKNMEVKRISVVLWLSTMSMILSAQADTTDVRYKIGYEIGSWLPFVILAGLFILMLVRARQRSERSE